MEKYSDGLYHAGELSLRPLSMTTTTTEAAAASQPKRVHLAL
jgi:hypothetical protein